MPTESFWSASADASPGGSTSRAKAPCAPYACTELEAFLAAHPEKRSPLLLAYIARQKNPGSNTMDVVTGR